MTTRNDDATGLRRSSSIPLWQQLSDILRRQIGEGMLQPGTRLPAEPELGSRFGVSRITVRAAIEGLIADDLVVRKQGKGTFVATPVVRQGLSDLLGIIPNLEAQGIRPQTRLVFFGHEPAPSRIAAALGTRDEPVMHFRRFYQLGEMPLGLCETWIPDAGAITHELAERTPSYILLSRHLGLVVGRADLVIKVRPADRPLARLLGMRPSEPLLCLERVSLTTSDQKCEYTRFWVRPDQYEFGLSVSGPMPIAAGIVRAA